MTRTKSTSNPTYKALEGTPFRSMTDHKREEQEIRLSVWRKLTEAKIINELVQKDEFTFFHEEFAHGITCKFDDANDQVVRVFSDGAGIQVSINRVLAKAIGDNTNAALEGLIRATTQSFGYLYYSALGLFISPPLDPGLGKQLTADKGMPSNR